MLNILHVYNCEFFVSQITDNPFMPSNMFFHDFRYREAAKQKSRIMRDRQNKPIDDVIYWVEYVVRHKGAKHLRVPYLDMPNYQIYLLDVIGVIFVGAIVIVLSLVFATMKLFFFITKHFNKSDNDKQLRKKKN